MKAHHQLGSLVLVVVLSAACGGGGGNSPTSPATPSSPAPTVTPPSAPTPPAAPATNEVIATSANTFSPASLTVAKGTTVTFTFQDVTHDVAFDATTGAPANIAASSSTAVQRLFATAGAFGYQCTLHPGMRGTVTVN